MTRTVLSVDDSKSIRDMIDFTLAPLGYRVIGAENGAEGLQKFRSETVNLVITDLNMPVMNGIDFIREVRRSPRDGRADHHAHDRNQARDEGGGQGRRGDRLDQQALRQRDAGRGGAQAGGLIMERVNPAIATFVEEAREQIEGLEALLLDLEQGASAEGVDSVFRVLHTLKGSGAMFGFTELARFTHHFEEAFDRLRDGRIGVDPRLVSLSLRARDHMRALLDLGGDGPEAAQLAASPGAAALIAELAAVVGAAAVQPPPGPCRPFPRSPFPRRPRRRPPKGCGAWSSAPARAPCATACAPIC